MTRDQAQDTVKVTQSLIETILTERQCIITLNPLNNLLEISARYTNEKGDLGYICAALNDGSA